MRGKFRLKKSAENKEYSNTHGHVGIGKVEEKRPVNEAPDSYVYEINNITIHEGVDQITQGTGPDEREREMKKKIPAAVQPYECGQQRQNDQPETSQNVSSRIRHGFIEYTENHTAVFNESQFQNIVDCRYCRFSLEIIARPLFGMKVGKAATQHE